MADSLTIDVDDAALLEALDSFSAVLVSYCDVAAKTTADAIQGEARAGIRRATPLTAAQQARPPLQDFIVVEAAKNGNGYVVIAKNPEGEFEGEALLLSWWLSAQWAHNRVSNPFMRRALLLEEGPHRDRMLTAVQSAIQDIGLGG